MTAEAEQKAIVEGWRRVRIKVPTFHGTGEDFEWVWMDFNGDVGTPPGMEEDAP